MSVRINAKIEGLNDLIKKMEGMRKSLKTKVLRSGMRKSVSLISKSAKRNTPVRSGQLKRSLGVKVKVYPSGVVIGVVEPRSGFRVPYSGGRRNFVSRRFIDPKRYAHLVEKGTQARFTKRGAFRGVMPARAFLYPAFVANERKIEGQFGDELQKELDKL